MYVRTCVNTYVSESYLVGVVAVFVSGAAAPRLPLGDHIYRYCTLMTSL